MQYKQMYKKTMTAVEEYFAYKIGHNARKNRWLIMLALTLIYIPMLHGVFNPIPQMDELKLSSGRLTIKFTRYKGNAIVINNDFSKLYTCANVLLSHNDCFSTDKLVSFYGKKADILWYDRSYYLWFTRRRIARIIIEGQEEYAYEKFVESSKRTKLSYVIALILIIPILIRIQMFSEKFERMWLRKKELDVVQQRIVDFEQRLSHLTLKENQNEQSRYIEHCRNRFL
jgi:hypothetical protein